MALHPCTHWIGDWVGPIAGLDAVKQRKISCLCGESNPSRVARSPSLYQLIYPIPTPWKTVKIISFIFIVQYRR
jgi:hypothetical protein